MLSLTLITGNEKSSSRFTIAESDLLTIAQRKTHYECGKSYHKELFTIDTRPCSVYVLYEEAGKVTQCFDIQPLPTSKHSHFTGLSGLASGHVIDIESTCIRDINNSVFGNDDFSHSSFRANKISKMRFDADIEIRLVSLLLIIQNMYVFIFELSTHATYKSRLFSRKFVVCVIFLPHALDIKAEINFESTLNFIFYMADTLLRKL